jgi:hypothetical protein
LTGERVERRLAAVLAADVEGYSRLMGVDEERTRLKAVRKAFVDPTIAAHRGRIVKTTGDGMLVEFASAVDAVRCAIEVLDGMAGQSADGLPDTRIEFRIGIHVGDIIFGQRVKDDFWNPDHINHLPAEVRAAVLAKCPTLPTAGHYFATYFHDQINLHFELFHCESFRRGLTVASGE